MMRRTALIGTVTVLLLASSAHAGITLKGPVPLFPAGLPESRPLQEQLFGVPYNAPPLPENAYRGTYVSALSDMVAWPTSQSTLGKGSSSSTGTHTLPSRRCTAEMH